MKHIKNFVLALVIISLSVVILTGCKKDVSQDGDKSGVYEIGVTMEGGTGRVNVISPCKIEFKDDVYTATVVFSSKNYTYVRIGETQYDAVNDDKTSTVIIPVSLDEKISIAAQTVAMGEPHEIEYTLYFDSKTMKVMENQ